VKKLITGIVCTFLILILNIAAYSLELSGNGTSENPYIISRYEEFYGIAEKINDGDSTLAASHFLLDASIDFYGRSHIPIGTEENPFTGVFDGNGYTLNNIRHSTANSSAGVFAYAENAVIKNLGVVDAEFLLAGAKENYFCGIICGSYTKTAKNTKLSFEKCYASGKITIISTSSSCYAGGVAGRIKSTVSGADIMIQNCEASCNINTKAKASYCGGFAGLVSADKSATTVEIKYLYTSGDIKAAASDGNAYCGGLIGFLKAEESGWGEWMSEEETAWLSSSSYALSNSISLCTVNAESTSGKAYSSFTVSQTESSPIASKLYCTGTDNSTGGIKGTTVDKSVIYNSSFVKNTLGFDTTSSWSLEGSLGLVRSKALCGVLSDNGKVSHVRANGYMDGFVIIAAYDADGRLTELKAEAVSKKDAEITAHFTDTPAKVRAFALKTVSCAPICKELILK